jgi:hypothetical protein
MNNEFSDINRPLLIGNKNNNLLLLDNNINKQQADIKQVNFEKHLPFLVLSIIWYFFIDLYTSSKEYYESSSCNYLRHYMLLLRNYYYYMILYQVACFVLEYLFNNTGGFLEHVTSSLINVGKVIFSFFGFFNILTVNYAYNLKEDCGKLRVLSFAWLFMVDSVTVVCVFVFIVVMFSRISIYKVLRFI